MKEMVYLNDCMGNQLFVEPYKTTDTMVYVGMKKVDKGEVQYAFHTLNLKEIKELHASLGRFMKKASV